MEFEIHRLEQIAYGAVLRAFKAQSDALTWDQQGTISDLRRELRVSDKEHKELLSEVDSDDLIHRIREWRESMKHKPFISGPPVGASSQLLRPHSSGIGTPQPLSSATKWGPSPGISAQRPHSYQYNVSSGAPVVESSVSMRDPLVGKKVMIRWPADNTFYEAVITDYNPADGRHSLVYDINTPDATLEWVNINEVPPDDIRWVNVEPIVPLIANKFASEYRPLVNEPVKDALDEIEIFHTDSLIKKVEKVLDGSQFNPVEINKAKQMLKEHEERLIQVISKLADVCDRGGGHEDNTEADILSV